MPENGFTRRYYKNCQLFTDHWQLITVYDLFHLLLQINQKIPNLLQRFKQFHFIFRFVAVYFEHFFCALQRITTFLHQVVYKSEILNIFFGKLAVAAAVLLRFEYIELCFPKTDQGRSNFKHGRDFANAKIFFLYIFLFVRQFDSWMYMKTWTSAGSKIQIPTVRLLFIFNSFPHSRHLCGKAFILNRFRIFEIP